MNELISVIVPIYNAEKYLEKCLDSIINQTYKNIEIILIDDGSKDNSLELCNKTKKKDKRIIVIHQDNQGVSYARNRGLNTMKGNYFIFIDSDDYIKPNMIEVLYNTIKKYKSDISVCNVVKVDEQGNILFTPQTKNKILLLTREEYISKLYNENSINGYPVNKLIRKELTKNIRFDTNIRHLEDWDYLCRMSNNVKKVAYIDEGYYYYYVMHKSSAIHEEFNKNWITDIIARDRNIDFVKYYSKHDKIRFYFDYVVISLNSLGYLKYYNELTKDDKIHFKKIIKKYFIKVIISKETTLFEKLKIILNRINPYFYYRMMKKIKYNKKGK